MSLPRGSSRSLWLFTLLTIIAPATAAQRLLGLRFGRSRTFVAALVAFGLSQPVPASVIDRLRRCSRSSAPRRA
ncbi:hypothetical protein ACTMTI_17670 [Nonomuraea sp. H19]|uniref:hypothetical protein n=1 Tax=Nonomuraea sp. H19 TaxID=3452206 RepID=UPI003F89F1CB